MRREAQWDITYTSLLDREKCDPESSGTLAFARGWAWGRPCLLFVGSCLLASACDDGAGTTPTTSTPPRAPALAPSPSPEPQPQQPAVPGGLRISASGEDFIEWSWTPVADVSGYDVHFRVSSLRQRRPRRGRSRSVGPRHGWCHGRSVTGSRHGTLLCPSVVSHP